MKTAKEVKTDVGNEIRKTTQGHTKMMRYISDLVRNKYFQRAIKKLRRTEKYFQIPTGYYKDWTPEQQKKHDEINQELASIISGYELLRKRCKKVLADRHFLYSKKIAYDFGLDGNLQNLARALAEKNIEKVKFWEGYIGDEADMCIPATAYEDEMSPLNKGDEIIYLSPRRQLSLIAYPVAIRIHPKAAKRDVLDYIEKRWKWIEALLRLKDEKALKTRKRKYSKEMLDFIWGNRFVPGKEMKKKLDDKFLHNGIEYYEIYKIISLEKARRLRR